MSRVHAEIHVRVPMDLCFTFCRDGYNDERWKAAYRSFRPDTDYSVTVKEETDHRLVMSVAAVNALTGTKVRSLGWAVEFTFSPTPEGTLVEVAIEYGIAVAVLAAGTLEGQAHNEVLHRLGQLIALELGYLAATSK